jgi:hypothetical protein
MSCKKPREHSLTNRSAPEFRREHLPGNAAANDKDNAGQTRAIRDARPSAFWSGGVESARTVGPDPTTHLEAAWRPHPVHATSADEDQASEVLLREWKSWMTAAAARNLRHWAELFNLVVI